MYNIYVLYIIDRKAEDNIALRSIIFLYAAFTPPAHLRAGHADV
jgi:hypothetical protein